MDKALVHLALIERIERDVAELMASQRAAQDGAFHEENKSEDDKDTRATEGSYLSRGLAERVVEAQEGLARVKVLALRAFDDTTPIALSALVEVEDEDTQARALYFLTPVGGGLRVVVGGRSVLAVTPQSPLGEALLGHRVDDDIQVISPQGERSLIVLSVS